MLCRNLALTCLTASLALAPTFDVLSRSAQVPTQDHVAWVGDVLQHMETVKVGMTREDLFKVFQGEGGLYTRESGHYVSRDCLYFKVDAEFKAVGPPDLDVQGRPAPGSLRDVIVKLSRPYIEGPVID